jgi:aspartyl-tRNA(Asn)/glutamyl-tRNA(Gln) amidotransferase subunit A
VSDLALEALAAAIRARRLSAGEAVEACLARIGRLDPTLNAFVAVDTDGARAAAGRRDAELAAHRPLGPLHGVPLACEDRCPAPGAGASGGTGERRYFVPEEPCTVVERLAAAGALPLGALNVTELGLGPFGISAHHGDVDNPARPGHCAGGASGGAAAAVAARLVPAAIAVDTDGGLLLSAAWCGVVGLKPTYGRVSRAGVMPVSWSHDHVGVVAGTVRDAALLLSVVAGRDPADATASARPVPDALAVVERGVAGLRIGVPDGDRGAGVDPVVAASVEEVARVLGQAGALVSGIRVPDPQPLVDVARLVIAAESAALHGTRAPAGLHPVVRARLGVGLRAPAHDYLQAARLRARLARSFAAVFAAVDLLLVPAAPEPAPRRADVAAGPVDAVVRRMTRVARFAQPLNALGLPAVAVPCGRSPAGLPLSALVAGRPFAETAVLRAARAWERASREGV